MRSDRRFVGALCALSVLVPAAALAATAGPVRLPAEARGEIIEAPGVEARAEVVTFGADLAPSLLQVAPGVTVQIAGWPVAPGVRADVRLTRFEIYAPGARIWKVEGDRRTEVPRSRMAFFRGQAEDDPDLRVFAAVEPDTGTFQGLALSPHGTYEIRPFPTAAGGRGHLVTVPDYFLLDDPETGEAQPLSWSCGQSEADTPLDLLPRETAGAPAGDGAIKPLFGAVLSSLHTVTVAVDTDNELLLQKFSDNTANATSYVAALIAAMNVIYERDLNIRLLQGDTNLRVSTTADPYSLAPDASGLVTSTQLSEFAGYWAANYGGIQRGLAMMLSGKSPSPNSSSGRAYIPGLCNTSFGYSFSQVFKFVGSTGATDAFVVGHELGHNFGSPHTHCYNPPIDTCFVQGGSCYSGPTSCPAATTINGVPNVRGTLMSYCHTLAGCSASNVFHPTTVDLITGIITPQIGTCVFPAITPPTVTLANPNHGLASGGTAVTITGTGFQNGATVTFGGIASPSVTFNSSIQLTATTPAHAVGLVNVAVTNPDTGSATAVNAFTFDPIPTISGLSPKFGPTAGGTTVTINGASFQNGATVTFGGASVAVTFNSSTQLTVTAPAHATGTVGVTVTNPDTGSGTLSRAFFYTQPPVDVDFYSLSPCRVLDTRNPNGPLGGPVLDPGTERSFTITGHCGVPVDATAIVANVTIVSLTGSGYLSIYPGNAFFLGTSNLTFETGEVLSNNAVLPLATDGTGAILVLNGAPGNTHVVLDVTGYFAE